MERPTHAKARAKSLAKIPSESFVIRNRDKIFRVKIDVADLHAILHAKLHVS